MHLDSIEKALPKYFFSVSPMIWIPNQLVGAPVGATVKLECHTESSPKAIAYWVFQDAMVLGTPRHTVSELLILSSLFKLSESVT